MHGPYLRISHSIKYFSSDVPTRGLLEQQRGNFSSKFVFPFLYVHSLHIRTDPSWQI